MTYAYTIIGFVIATDMFYICLKLIVYKHGYKTDIWFRLSDLIYLHSLISKELNVLRKIVYISVAIGFYLCILLSILFPLLIAHRYNQ